MSTNHSKIAGKATVTVRVARAAGGAVPLIFIEAARALTRMRSAKPVRHAREAHAEVVPATIVALFPF